MKKYAKSFIFSDLENYGVPDGVHFAVELSHGVEVLIFSNPPSCEIKRIPSDAFKQFLEDGTVVDAEAHVNALLQDGLSKMLTKD
jgi:hypothetical protein